jgi:hypothetical protein
LHGVVIDTKDNNIQIAKIFDELCNKK